MSESDIVGSLTSCINACVVDHRTRALFEHVRARILAVEELLNAECSQTTSVAPSVHRKRDELRSLKERVDNCEHRFSFVDVPDQEVRCTLKAISSAKVRQHIRTYHRDLDNLAKEMKCDAWQPQFDELSSMHVNAWLEHHELRSWLDDEDQVRVLELRPFALARQSDHASTYALNLLDQLPPAVVSRLKQWFPMGLHLKEYYTPYARLKVVIETKIGEGGYGEIYRGTWQESTAVAIKTLIKRSSTSSSSQNPHHREVSRFFSEADIWSRLKHPNILSLYCASFIPRLRSWVLLIELAQDNLASFLQKGNNRARWSWKLLYETAVGLQYLHDVGRVLHRDLHIKNILVANNSAKLTDFGLSWYCVGSAFPSPIKRAKYWDAPEVVQGARAVCYRSDIFAFGTVLYEVLTGCAPWSSGRVGMNVAKSGTHPEIPDNERATALFKKMCAYDAKDRPDARDVVKVLREIYEEEQERRPEQEDGMTKEHQPDSPQHSESVAGTAGSTSTSLSDGSQGDNDPAASDTSADEPGEPWYRRLWNWLTDTSRLDSMDPETRAWHEAKTRELLEKTDRQFEGMKERQREIAGGPFAMHQSSVARWNDLHNRNQGGFGQRSFGHSNPMAFSFPNRNPPTNEYTEDDEPNRGSSYPRHWGF